MKVMRGKTRSGNPHRIKFYPKVVMDFPFKIMVRRQEAHWLQKIPKVIKSGVYVELGTYRGGSTYLMANTIKKMNSNVRFITIDTFDNKALSKSLKSEAQAELNYSIVKNLMQTLEFDFVEVVKSDTVMAAELYPDLEVDFLFIDADHSYTGVKSDFKAWSPKVKKDGLIAFHDSNFEPVKQFQSEIEDWVQIDGVETLTVWRRKTEDA
jgi:predicted O-methyltransferase YrrM